MNPGGVLLELANYMNRPSESYLTWLEVSWLESIYFQRERERER